MNIYASLYHCENPKIVSWVLGLSLPNYIYNKYKHNNVCFLSEKFLLLKILLLPWIRIWCPLAVDVSLNNLKGPQQSHLKRVILFTSQNLRKDFKHNLIFFFFSRNLKVSHQDLQNNLSFQTRLSGDRIPESMPPISRMNISKYQRERETFCRTCLQHLNIISCGR